MTNPLRSHSVCIKCQQPTHTDGDPKRGWIHTQTDRYSCEGESGFVEPMGLYDLEDKLVEANQEGFDEGKADGLVEGLAQGAAEGRDAALSALKDELDRMPEKVAISDVFRAVERVSNR
ncbi:hypothetical protein SEA_PHRAPPUCCINO_19 [Mycobacterium phage Phrappuccino]|uniref:Uncharacterized protein n=1 Tax=Mycobacterium phage Phrappuccino TaxID=2591223 RepID=A0A514DDM1_9CAUD|nr:hypothetical protein KHQ87_gp019 [Mycobacterium phage Phrappuccino]QDH91697.1 hypothetical protein SEA_PHRAPPUCCINO_19 [Mycobacterium phage Phrappuccino]QIQ63141.1 hypothetical protein SEA_SETTECANDELA_19 [Mycobacterium phage Settecandela]